MNITEEDTPATVRLKFRIRDLEVENMVLRDKAGAFDGPRFATVSDLPTMDIHDGATELRLMASWEARRDRITGRIHALGLIHTPSSLRLNYFIEDALHTTRDYRENVLMEIHKRLIHKLASAT